MAESSQLPKFGNWENEENYTAYFDNPRKKKGSRRMNPNDPHDDTPPNQPHPLKQEDESKGLMGTEPIKWSRNKVESEEPRSADMLRPGTCETPKRESQKSGGYDQSIDQSPLHAHYKARVGGGKVNGASSPSWERKGSSEASQGLAPSTPGRSRLRSVARGDDNPDHGPVVPKFGEWDESDPASAEGYSHIFEEVRKEKQIEAGKVPAMATEAPYSNGQNQYRNANPKSCCCFPWARK